MRDLVPVLWTTDDSVLDTFPISFAFDLEVRSCTLLNLADTTAQSGLWRGHLRINGQILSRGLIKWLSLWYKCLVEFDALAWQCNDTVFVNAKAYRLRDSFDGASEPSFLQRTRRHVHNSRTPHKATRYPQNACHYVYKPSLMH